MADKNVITAEPELVLQELQPRFDINEVIWVSGISQFCGGSSLLVLRM